jgi:putative sigma-54 modulation protein
MFVRSSIYNILRPFTLCSPATPVTPETLQHQVKFFCKNHHFSLISTINYERNPSRKFLPMTGSFTKNFFIFFQLKNSEVMKVNIQTQHFDADKGLVSYIEKKLEKINQFHDRITSIDVYLKLDNVVHTIKDKIAEIRVHIPRYDFFVKHSSKSFEESFDTALDSVITQIKRRKEKLAA